MMGIKGLNKKEKSRGGFRHWLLDNDALKRSTVYVVKWPVLGFQQAPENSECSICLVLSA